jgi:hypothetical protein
VAIRRGGKRDARSGVTTQRPAPIVIGHS